MRRSLGMTDPVDPVPHSEHVSFDQVMNAPGLEERLQAFVRQAISQVAVQGGAGSFEEEDDFDVADDDDPNILSDYQVLEMVRDGDFAVPETDEADAELEERLAEGQAAPQAQPEPPSDTEDAQ